MLELATGKHQVSVLRNGREPFGREISVTRGQELTLVAPLEKTTRPVAVISDPCTWNQIAVPGRTSLSSSRRSAWMRGKICPARSS